MICLSFKECLVKAVPTHLDDVCAGPCPGGDAFYMGRTDGHGDNSPYGYGHSPYRQNFGGGGATGSGGSKYVVFEKTADPACGDSNVAWRPGGWGIGNGGSIGLINGKGTGHPNAELP